MLLAWAHAGRDAAVFQRARSTAVHFRLDRGFRSTRDCTRYYALTLCCRPRLLGAVNDPVKGREKAGARSRGVGAQGLAELASVLEFGIFLLAL
jgi:hypothetical protein